MLPTDIRRPSCPNCGMSAHRPGCPFDPEPTEVERLNAEVERLALWRDEAMRDVQALKAEAERLREKAAAFDVLAEDVKQAAYRLLSVRRDHA